MSTAAAADWNVCASKASDSEVLEGGKVPGMKVEVIEVVGRILKEFDDDFDGGEKADKDADDAARNVSCIEIFFMVELLF